MKIFNWVHRRFSHKVEFSQNVKKVDGDAMFTKEGGDTQALLDNVVHLTDFLDGWQGGVLAIGTLGLTIKQENNYIDQFYYKKEDSLFSVDDDESEVDQVVNNDQDGDEELNPLVVMNKGSNCYPAAGAFVSRGTTTPVDNDIAASDSYSVMMMKKKERITLADLFSAELGHDNNGISSVNSSKNRKLMHPAHAAKQVFPKKLIIPAAAGVKDDSRLLKKLNQLMKKMLKRKIHPNAEAEDYQSSISRGNILASDKLCNNNESVSLLQNPSNSKI